MALERIFAIAGFLLLAACAATPKPEPIAPGALGAPTKASQTEVTEDDFSALMSAIARLFVEHARTSSGTPEEILSDLSPMSEFALSAKSAAMAELELHPERVAAFVEANPEAVERISSPILHKMLSEVRLILEQRENKDTRRTLTWGEDLDEGLAAARKDGKPLLVFFTAYWALSCRELEQKTLSDARVAPLLTSDFHLVKLDVTDDEAPRSKAVLTRLNVTGLPTILVLDSREVEKLRVIEVVTVDELLAKLKALR